ncbi:MAG: amidohydrolase family protein, partial [Planctomycetaceae bacterium]
MIVDVNVNVSRWPFRRLPFDDTPALVERLSQSDVVEAWAGSFDGLFHEDVAQVNRRLVEECNSHGAGLLQPIGTVNPTLPDWQDDVRRCAEEHGMRGIRLHPNYHGYTLDDPRFAELLTMAESRGLIVQLVFYMEDPRT